MTLTLIAAQDRNGAIGHRNAIPWHIPEDLAFFKRETTGDAVIMGRKTWDSLPRKPLPGRLNIVITRSPACYEGEAIFTSLDRAVETARQAGYDRLYCIGGAEIYRQMMPLADRILLTTVEITAEAADTFFPAIDPAEWRIVDTRILRSTPPACSVSEYVRADCRCD